MSITMNMSSYEIECDSMEDMGGEEVGYKSWNTTAMMCQQQLFVPSDRKTGMPVSLVAADAELFLQKMGIYQR